MPKGRLRMWTAQDPGAAISSPSIGGGRTVSWPTGLPPGWGNWLFVLACDSHNAILRRRDRILPHVLHDCNCDVAAGDVKPECEIKTRRVACPWLKPIWEEEWQRSTGCMYDEKAHERQCFDEKQWWKVSGWWKKEMEMKERERGKSWDR